MASACGGGATGEGVVSDETRGTCIRVVRLRLLTNRSPHLAMWNQGFLFLVAEF
jgi:hypothetical protein